MPVRTGAVGRVGWAADAMSWEAKGARVLPGKRFFACPAAALAARRRSFGFAQDDRKRKEIPDQVGHDV